MGRPISSIATRSHDPRASHELTGKQRVHFLHIGKTGGSAIKHALREHLNGDRYVIHLHFHRVNLRDVPEGQKVFFFLRDPIDRIVSGFYSRKRQGQPRIFSAWSDDEAVAFGRFQTPDQLGRALSSANPEERGEAHHAMQSIFHVRDSYWKWFESDEYLRSRQSDILLIGFQRNLTLDFEILRSKLHLPDKVRLPSDDVRSHRNPRGLDTALGEKALKNLRAWCEDDYRLIHRCEEIIEQEGCGGTSERQP